MNQGKYTDLSMPSLDERQRFSVIEASRLLRISRSLLYVRIKDGQIKTIKDGARRLIPGSEIVRLSAA